LQVSGQVSLHLSFQHWPISFASSHLELLRTFTIFLTCNQLDEKWNQTTNIVAG